MTDVAAAMADMRKKINEFRGPLLVSNEKGNLLEVTSSAGVIHLTFEDDGTITDQLLNEDGSYYDICQHRNVDAAFKALTH